MVDGGRSVTESAGLSGATGAARSLLASPQGGLSVLALLLPLLGLGALLAAPDADFTWEHHPSHFWLVLAAAAVNVALAYATGIAARRRADARVLLVSLAFLAAAGFLGLHALATPGVLLDEANAGFGIATPVGLLVAAFFAAASSMPLDGPRAQWVIANGRWLQLGLVGVMVAWAVASLTETTALNDPTAPERASGPMVALAIAAVALYGLALVRYLALYARRRSTLLLGMVAGFLLLAEAMVAVAFSRNWHATWWEWHLLMLAAFVLIAYSAHRQWHEERFSDLYLEETASGVREVSILFADLCGFTRFAESRPPREVSAMLNEYFEVSIPPIVRRHGGEVDRIIGDALMAVWGRRGEQPDHAERAAAAALEIQRATARIAAENEGWPRFRVGVNSGEVAVGILGASGGRTHTVIGDVVNVAARLEASAPEGGVAVGVGTATRLPAGAAVEPLGEIAVKGREDPVEAYLLRSVEHD